MIEEHEKMLSRFERFSKWQVFKAAVAVCIEYKRRLNMIVSIADRGPLVVDGPQVNGRSLVNVKVAQLLPLWPETLNKQKQKFLSSCKRIISIKKSRF